MSDSPPFLNGRGGLALDFWVNTPVPDGVKDDLYKATDRAFFEELRIGKNFKVVLDVDYAASGSYTIFGVTNTWTASATVHKEITGSFKLPSLCTGVCPMDSLFLVEFGLSEPSNDAHVGSYIDTQGQTSDYSFSGADVHLENVRIKRDVDQLVIAASIGWDVSFTLNQDTIVGLPYSLGPEILFVLVTDTVQRWLDLEGVPLFGALGSTVGIVFPDMPPEDQSMVGVDGQFIGRATVAGLPSQQTVNPNGTTMRTPDTDRSFTTVISSSMSFEWIP